MAERRMFAKTIVTSDAFLDMPLSTRCLYFTLGMFADDDGFVNNPKSIMRQVGASIDDLNILIAKRFILTFDSGIIVIKHWRIHNYIQNDRYKQTKYLEEKKTLCLDEKGAYTECIQDVSNLDTQDRLELGKDSIELSKDNNTPQKRFCKPTIEEVQAYCEERNNGVDAQKWFDYYEANGWKVGRNAMKDWKASVRTWERSDTKDEKHKGKSVRTIDYGKYTDEL